jgi:hypothetical protein
MNPVSKETLPLLSFIVGLGVAVLCFHKPFQIKPVLPISLAEIEGKTIKNNNKCYQYHAEDVQCEILSLK